MDNEKTEPIPMGIHFPDDYLERVYAGVLGKIIGVYFGRPVENWLYENISARFGSVDHYLNGEMGTHLVTTDDDIAGTFIIIRALEDAGYSRQITPQQIGQAWLNYIIENRTIFWWGGLNHSTEHTAYLNLTKGIPAPESGSVAQNGPVIANQIGAQIYIDSWAMISPGDPEQAADLARRAASVSHDDQAIRAAQVIAAMEAQAFVERDIDRLIDTGLSVIPRDSIIYRMIQDIRGWWAIDEDWHKTRARINAEYGYKKYVGGCHVVPNHALIILGLLYGGGDLRKSLSVCTSAGWDTDCNSGNLGCLLGIRGGLESFQSAPDLREPVADRLFLPNADSGRAITDAVIEAYYLVNTARRINRLEALRPKEGMRFHFELPGSRQGFQVLDENDSAQVSLQNAAGHSRLGRRSLRVSYRQLSETSPAQVSTATFVRPDELWDMGYYQLVASPTLYPGQTIRAGLSAGPENAAPVRAGLFLSCYNADDQPAAVTGPEIVLPPGEVARLEWTVPDTNSGPIFEIGLTLQASAAQPDSQPGSIYLDFLGWTGAPRATFTRPQGSSLPFPGPLLFRRAWADSVDMWPAEYQQAFRVIQNRGRGMLSTGTREWTDYTVSARVTIAKARAAGIAARVQGQRRFYAFLLVEGQRGAGPKVRLLKALNEDSVLAETDFSWKIWRPYELAFEVQGNQLRAWIDGSLVLEATDDQQPLSGGGIGLVVERGHIATPWLRVEPA